MTLVTRSHYNGQVMPKILLSERLSSELLSFLLPDHRDLIQDSLLLMEQQRQLLDEPATTSVPPISDFSFILFPMAKAYEGFLKLYFLRLGIITDAQYRGQSFRIGRSFNPDIVDRLRDHDWLYDDVARLCSPDVARQLWQLWLDGRNHLFHFFPNDRYQLTYMEAEKLLRRFLVVMEDATSALPSR